MKILNRWTKEVIMEVSGDPLQGANLQGANLQRANLQRADLQRADLRGADLQGANLQGANLWVANLQRANLWVANLQGAYLQRANLQEANLQEADLQEADLQEANLQEANLRGADLRRANLREANLPHFSIVPEEGSFIGFKKVYSLNINGPSPVILTILITTDSKRVSPIGSRKCRASKITILKSDPETENQKFMNWQQKRGLKKQFFFSYEVGETYETEFNPDIREECSKGFHFFLTKKEAEEWK